MKKHYYTESILNACDGFHCTVDEIFKKIQKEFPEAGKSSIYRNVEQLAEKGKLTKITGIGKKVLFEKTKEAHAHFICTQSNRIIDIPLKKSSSLPHSFISDISDISEKFTIDAIDIKIYGTLKKENNKSKNKNQI